MKYFLSILIFGVGIKQKKVPEQYREDYFREFQRINLQSARVMTMLGFFLVPASIILDYFIYPEQLLLFGVVRTIVSIGCLGLFALTYFGKLKSYSTIITMSAMFLVGAGISYMIRVLGYESPYYAGLNLIYLAAVILPWGMLNTLFASLVVYSFFLVPILLFDRGSLNIPAFINNNVFQLETIIIISVVNHFQAIRRRNEVVNRLTIAHQAKELAEIDRFKREFIANITHELKTPLAIVMGNADIIRDRISDEDLHKGIDEIRNAASQLANHVDRIITVSNVDDPDTRPDLAYFDYLGVVRNVFSMFENRAREEKLTYALHCESGSLVVNIDIVKIEEVLGNLIQNAFKFTPAHGLISVTVSTDGQSVYTEVADSGVGIPKDKIDRIFDRMYQADEVLSKRHSGIGLGLYICRKNVEIHGGEITVHSTQGKGSSFKFRLPLHFDQNAEVKNKTFDGEDRREAPRRSGSDRRTGFDRRTEERHRSFEYIQRMGVDELARMTYSDNVRDFENLNPSKPSVLIVEDNAGMMKVIVEALRDDYNLFLAFDAFEAERKLENIAAPVSLVLSDIMMPEVSGFELIKKVMAKESLKHIPFIFISALMSQEDQIKGFELGAADYIVKPYNIKILKEKVDHWISRRRYELLLKEATVPLEEKIEQLKKAKDVIIHEIGNPLQMITGASYFVERLKAASYGRASEDEKQLWESVKALDQGLKAIKDVVEATRHIDMSELTHRQPASVLDIVGDAVKQTEHILGAIRLVSEDEGAGECVIKCDRRMLVQVLVNIIRNAAEAIMDVRFPEEGAIQVKTTTLEDRIVRISVSDNGSGMSQEVMENLFSFKYTSKKDGTGIGLYLSRIILKLHDGSIKVESKEGEGTTFTLSLPLCFR